MKLRIICCILLVLLAVACTTMSEDKIEDLKTKIINANTEVNSFKFKSTSSIDVAKEGEEMALKVDINGAMDRNAKKLMAKGEMDMGEMKLPVETYSDGNFIYTNNMNQWIKMEISPEMFEMQDQSKYLMDFFKESEIDAKEADGYYEIKVIPKEGALKELAQKNSPIPLDDIGLDLFKNLEIIYFVNKENFIADKVKMKYDMSISEATMKTDMIYEMFDVNKPVDIVIPEEASNAIDFAEFQKEMAKNLAQQETEINVTE